MKINEIEKGKYYIVTSDIEGIKSSNINTIDIKKGSVITLTKNESMNGYRLIQIKGEITEHQDSWSNPHTLSVLNQYAVLEVNDIDVEEFNFGHEDILNENIEIVHFLRGDTKYTKDVIKNNGGDWYQRYWKFKHHVEDLNTNFVITLK